MEDNLLLPNDWATGGEDVSRPLVIAGDPGKCGRRCTLDAGANGVKRRALYIRVGAEAEAGPRPRAPSLALATSSRLIVYPSLTLAASSSLALATSSLVSVSSAAGRRRRSLKPRNRSSVYPTLRSLEEGLPSPS